MLSVSVAFITICLPIRGAARDFPTGADSSDEGVKIWFSGYNECQKSPTKSLFTFRRGAITH